MPLLIAFKALCDRIERLAPIGEFLSSAQDARGPAVNGESARPAR